MAYRTIVIGTDGSPTANLAQAAALRVARVFRSEIVFRLRDGTESAPRHGHPAAP